MDIGHLHDPNTALPQPFLHEIEQGVVTESWAEGLSMLHNPKASHPVDYEMFPGIARHWFDDGQIRSLVPEFRPYSSLCWNLLAIDDMPGQQSQPKSAAAP